MRPTKVISSYRTTYQPTRKCLSWVDILVVCLIVWIFVWLFGWLVYLFLRLEAAISSETFVPSDKSHVVIHQKVPRIDNSRPQTHYT